MGALPQPAGCVRLAGTGRRAPLGDPEHEVRAWTARLSSLPEQHAAIVVEHEGEVVGFALAQLDAESGAELNATHVLPEPPGPGAGKSLMDGFFRGFGGGGVPGAHLHVI